MEHDSKVGIDGDPRAPDNCTFMFQNQWQAWLVVYVGNLPPHVGKDFLQTMPGQYMHVERATCVSRLEILSDTSLTSSIGLRSHFPADSHDTSQCLPPKTSPSRAIQKSSPEQRRRSRSRICRRFCTPASFQDNLRLPTSEDFPSLPLPLTFPQRTTSSVSTRLSLTPILD